MPIESINENFYFPDICRNTSVLMIVVVVELLAIIVVLAFHQSELLKHLGFVSLYLLWVTLISVFALCRMRTWISQQKYIVGFCTALVICLLAFTAVELFAQYILYGISQQSIHWDRFLRFLVASALTSLILLRFVSLLGVLEWRHKVEAQARLQSLQSRIRPHFLFNCLNTISELVATEPEQAEQAIASLSSLFRASLGEAKNMHTLDSEIHLCERYLDLERWRIADKLDVEWVNSIENTRTWQVPKLILQPLIENAVMHGADQYGRIKLTIDLRESKTDLSIKVVNRQGVNDQGNNDHEGNGIALNNIRERLFVLYDDQQAFRVRNDSDKYQVIMRFPKKAFAAQSNLK